MSRELVLDLKEMYLAGFLSDPNLHPAVLQAYLIIVAVATKEGHAIITPLVRKKFPGSSPDQQGTVYKRLLEYRFKDQPLVVPMANMEEEGGAEVVQVLLSPGLFWYNKPTRNPAPQVVPETTVTDIKELHAAFRREQPAPVVEAFARLVDSWKARQGHATVRTTILRDWYTMIPGWVEDYGTDATAHALRVTADKAVEHPAYTQKVLDNQRDRATRNRRPSGPPPAIVPGTFIRPVQETDEHDF